MGEGAFTINVRVIVCVAAPAVVPPAPPQFEFLICGLSEYVLLPVQVPKFANSTETGTPDGSAVQPNPTNQATPPIVTDVAVAVLRASARVCTSVESDTVTELPKLFEKVNEL